jgi:Rrf2 family protein
MAANSRYTVALHSLLLLEGPDGGWTSSDWIASSVNTNPVVIRRILSELKSAKLVAGVHGRAGGYRLRREPGDVTLWDVYQVFREEEGPFALHAKKPNPQCPVGGRIQKHLKVVYAEADDSMRKVLSKTTLASLRERLRGS